MLPVDWGPGRVIACEPLWGDGRGRNLKSEAKLGHPVWRTVAWHPCGELRSLAGIRGVALCILCNLRQRGSSLCSLLLLPCVSCSVKSCLNTCEIRIMLKLFPVISNTRVRGEQSVPCGTALMSQGYSCKNRKAWLKSPHCNVTRTAQQ